MGQKVHPVGFRLGITAEHSSKWFAKVRKSNQYAQFLSEDTLIRDFLFQEAPSLHHVTIQRKNSALILHLESGQPNEILENLDTLKQKLQKKLFASSQKVFLLERGSRISSDETNGVQSRPPYAIFCTVSPAKATAAKSIAFFIKHDLEKRLPFRRAVKKSLRLAKTQGVKGMKIQISGRLNGAEIARTEWERFGAVSLQSLRSQIDYTECIAHTIYGVLGIKVWVQYES
jgi:small subunit ribosomal protein S3